MWVSVTFQAVHAVFTHALVHTMTVLLLLNAQYQHMTTHDSTASRLIPENAGVYALRVVGTNWGHMQPVARGDCNSTVKTHSLPQHSVRMDYYTHVQVHESALSTVKQPCPGLFVDKTFERSNLRTWNIVHRPVITKVI